MKRLLYVIGTALVQWSGYEDKAKTKLFEIIKTILDAVRDGNIDEEEFNQIKKKAYDCLIDFGFDNDKGDLNAKKK